MGALLVSAKRFLASQIFLERFGLYIKQLPDWLYFSKAWNFQISLQLSLLTVHLFFYTVALEEKKGYQRESVSVCFGKSGFLLTTAHPDVVPVGNFSDDWIKSFTQKADMQCALPLRSAANSAHCIPTLRFSLKQVLQDFPIHTLWAPSCFSWVANQILDPLF